MFLSNSCRELEEALQNTKDEMNAELDELDGELEAKRVEVEKLEIENERLSDGIKQYEVAFKTKEKRELLLIDKLKSIRAHRDSHYNNTRTM